MANINSGVIFFVMFMQCCVGFSQGTRCTPSSKFLQRLVERGGYQSYYCNGSCFIKKLGTDGVGGIVSCINVEKKTVVKANGITFTVQGNPIQKLCG